MVSGCSTKKLIAEVRIPDLPHDFETPCAKLNNIESTSAEDNFFWALDTIIKYNECTIKKDGVTKAYQQIQNKD